MRVMQRAKEYLTRRLKILRDAPDDETQKKCIETSLAHAHHYLASREKSKALERVVEEELRVALDQKALAIGLLEAAALGTEHYCR